MKRFVLFSVLALSASLAQAEVAVIVHPSNAATISSDDVQRIFLGKAKQFPGGAEAVPVAMKEGAATREAFNQGLLGKNESQMKAYWSQLVFTGKGTPPKEVDDDAAVIALVAANPSLIGYVDASKVGSNVKVVLKK